RLPAKAPLF
nr:Chain P, ARG-LEU-PRO-ALA-LYS-ALA-PRO-LEU-PHE [Mycobacteriaceae]6GHN_Q Chain Q, ARG-LEU-PRO-ALA-LYS-ALA-PRO-LEU-PHE [Mycobacteriaceae]